MDRRLEFHEVLMNTSGLSNVYFQPPPSVRMIYPCVVYQRERIQTYKADNINYRDKVRYQVTYISRSPDDLVINKFLSIPYSSHERFFVSENLNHDVFIIYF